MLGAGGEGLGWTGGRGAILQQKAISLWEGDVQSIQLQKEKLKCNCVERKSNFCFPEEKNPLKEIWGKIWNFTGNSPALFRDGFEMLIVRAQESSTGNVELSLLTEGLSCPSNASPSPSLSFFFSFVLEQTLSFIIPWENALFCSCSLFFSLDYLW